MKFTKKAFRAWLESFSDQKKVGRPEHTQHCPLCEFLKSQGGVNKIYMGFEHRIVNEKSIFNPPWAVYFQIDACDFVKGDGFRSITAKRALSFL